MEQYCPACRTVNYGWASLCRICSGPLPIREQGRVQPPLPESALSPQSSVPPPTEAALAWAEGMQREIGRWQENGLISPELGRQLAERYSWRQVVLTELARWQQEGLLPESVVGRLRAQYIPPIAVPITPIQLPAVPPADAAAPPSPAPAPPELPPPQQPMPPDIPAGQPLPAEPLLPQAVPLDRPTVPPEPVLISHEAMPAVTQVDLIMDAGDLAAEPQRDGAAAAAASLSGVQRLLQFFVDEANLSWLLYLGIFLIVASSVFLVASQWSYIPYSLQYLILLVYTSGFYWAAWQMLSRFALRRTGGALVVVTTLLIPLNFWGMQALGLFRDAAGWFLALPAAGWLSLMTYLCASHIHRDVGRRFTLAFIPLAMAQAVIGFWAPSWSSLAVTLLVVGTVWAWTRSTEPAFADAMDRRATWIFMLGGLAYGGLLTIGRYYGHTGLSPLAPLTGPLLALWAMALLMVAWRFPDVERPERPTIVHLAAYFLPLFGMVLAHPEPVMLWGAAAVGIPIYLQAVRSHGRPLYFYLAALAVGITYYFTPALFPVIMTAFRDKVAMSLGYVRLPFPFYGITLFPLALLALGTGHVLQQRKHPLERHALGLACALAFGCLLIAWHNPVAQAWSLALTTFFGVLFIQLIPYPGLPYVPSATGFLAVLALGNWLTHRLYYGANPFQGTWTWYGRLVLAVLAALWTIAGYWLWWTWRWRTSWRAGTPAPPAGPVQQASMPAELPAPKPSAWQWPLAHVGMLAASWALLLGGWDSPGIFALASAVALAAAHLHPRGLFMAAFLVIFQVTLIDCVIQYLPFKGWLLCLVLLNAVFLAGAVGAAGIMERITRPPRPFLRLGRYFMLAMDSDTWPGGAEKPNFAVYHGLNVSAFLYGALLLLFQVVTLFQVLGWTWDWFESPTRFWISGTTSVVWVVAPFLLAPFVQSLWMYTLPAFAFPVTLLGVLIGIYWLLCSTAVPGAALAYITIAFAALALGAVRLWESAASSTLSYLCLPTGRNWHAPGIRLGYRLIPVLLVLGLMQTSARLTIGTSAAIGLVALVWLSYGLMAHPALASDGTAAELTVTSTTSDRAAYIALSLITMGSWWLLFCYAYWHGSSVSLPALGVPMALIALIFAYLWQVLTWKFFPAAASSKPLTGSIAQEKSLPICEACLDWCRRGLFHRLAIGHAAVALVAVSIAMIAVSDQPIGIVLTALGVYGALAALAAGFASWSDRHRTKARAEFWIYVAQVSLAFIYAYLRLTTDWLTSLDEYAPIVLILAAYLLIGVRRVAAREGLNYVVQPAHVVALVAAVGTLVTVGWKAVAEQLTLINPMAIWLAAGLFTHLASAVGLRPYAYAAALLYNAGLYLLWWTYGITDQQSFLIPAGLLVLWFAQFNREDLPRSTINQLRLAGLLIIYGSSAGALLSIGTGLPALILAITCVLGILAGIALRIRAYLYLGALFLFLDVADQLVFFSTQYAPAKWIVGFSLGLLLVAIAVLFESQREQVLARIKSVTDELARWE